MCIRDSFERRGFIFKGMFDANPELVGKDVRGVKVMPLDQLESFIRENDIDVYKRQPSRSGPAIPWDTVSTIPVPLFPVVYRVSFTQSIPCLLYTSRCV